MTPSVNFDRASSFYDRTRGFPVGVDTQIASFLAQSSGLQASDHLLEIGIGTGRISLPLLPYLGTISGVDISAEMLGTLRAKTSGEQIYTTLGDAHALPYPDQRFDAALIVHVLHLVADPQQVCNEIRRVLKPGGTFIHCVTRHGKEDAVNALWNQLRPDRRRGASWERTAAWMAANLPQPEEFVWTYVTTETPRKILDAIHNRYWSSLWNTTDEELAPAIQAVEALIEDQFHGNYDVELTRETHFVVQVFRNFV